VSNFKVGDRVGLLVDCGMGGKGVVIKTYDFTCDIRTDEGFLITLYDSHLIKEEKMNYKDDDVVTATAGRIRSAAGKCPQANQVLREVYPEVFKEEVEFQVGDIVEYIGTSHENLQGEHGIVVKADNVSCIRVSFWKSGCLGYYILPMSLKLILRPNLICTPKS
jgi:hypothetical protein